MRHAPCGLPIEWREEPLPSTDDPDNVFDLRLMVPACPLCATDVPVDELAEDEVMSSGGQ